MEVDPNGVSVTGSLVSDLAFAARAFLDRFRPPRIATVEDLATFVRTRSSYIAQTSLHGYLKTRMGTSFQSYFQDPVFSESIRIASVKLFAACAADLAIFAAATTARDGALAPAAAADLACRCYAEALDAGLEDGDLAHLSEDARQRVRARAAVTDWQAAAHRENAFAGSVDALVLYAPVIDEFKKADALIVRNSIRFRWRDVREQLRRRLDAPAIAGALGSQPGPVSGSG